MCSPNSPFQLISFSIHKYCCNCSCCERRRRRQCCCCCCCCSFWCIYGTSVLYVTFLFPMFNIHPLPQSPWFRIRALINQALEILFFIQRFRHRARATYRHALANMWFIVQVYYKLQADKCIKIWELPFEIKWNSSLTCDGMWEKTNSVEHTLCVRVLYWPDRNSLAIFSIDQSSILTKCIASIFLIEVFGCICMVWYNKLKHIANCANM